MKKKILFFLTLIAAGFADNIVLENQTSKSKIMVQWASTAKEVDDDNKAILNGDKPNPSTLQLLTKTGKVNVSIPKNAEYFRVLAWSKDQEDPDLLTNWVDVVPNKTYTLQADHLVPLVLMAGTGC